jgi:hypothetical protein
MKANEFRIGNLVFYINGGLFEVIGIHQFGLDVEDDIETTYMEYENFNPIPLTEEWLLRFGFKRQGNRNMWVKGKVCVVLENYRDLSGKLTGEKFYIGFKDLGNVIFHTTFECPYVHTLQNAFALTGEELTLEGDENN